MIKILHAYPNLMNIFGADADLKVLVRYLEDAGQRVEISSFETEEEISFKGVNFFYCGAGTEDRMKFAEKDFERHKSKFIDYVSKGGHALLVGNGMILASDWADVKLEVKDYRHYSDVIGRCTLTGDRIVGAYNSSTLSSIHERPFLELEVDTNSHLSGRDGFVKENVIGTEVEGPLLVRNPEFLAHYADIITGKKLPENKSMWYQEACKGHCKAIKMLED